ncbi:MAG: glycosyltransferase family 4 protein [Ferruginibacter sp.]
MVTERQYRGAQVFASELTHMLAKSGHEVLFVGLYPAKENILVAKGAENIDLDGKKTAFDLGLMKRLMALIKKNKPDIIQANGSDTLKYAVFAKLFNSNLRIVYRNISIVSARATPIKIKFNRFLFTRVNQVTSVGKDAMLDLSKTYGYPLDKMRVIRRGIPEMMYDRSVARKKIAAEFGFQETDFILSYTAQFSPEKNQAFLIESLEKVLAHGIKARLLFIGLGDLLEEIKVIVAQKKLGKHVFFTGYRQNVQEILCGSDLFVFSSKIEGVPGAILEAGMQSLPTIAVSAGGIGEAMNQGKSGILLNKFDSTEFSQAVIGLLENDEERKRLGDCAKAFVLENYGLQNCLKQFVNLYEEILNEKRPS